MPRASLLVDAELGILLRLALFAGRVLPFDENAGTVAKGGSALDPHVVGQLLHRTEGRRAQGELQRIREMTGTMRARDGGTLSDTDRTYLQDRLDQLGSTIHWMAHN